MRKSLILFGTMVLIMACNAKHNFQISGSIQGIEPNTTVYLEKLDPFTKKIVKVDSTQVNNTGYFEFKSNVDNVDMAFIAVKHLVHKAPFFIEPGNIHLTYDLNSNEVPQATGAKYNDQYIAYNEKVTYLTKKASDYYQSTQEAYKQAMAQKEVEKANDIVAVYESISKELQDFKEQYPQENPGSIVNLINLYNALKTPSKEKEEYQEQWEIIDIELQNTPIGQKIIGDIQAMPTILNKVGQKAPNFEALTPKGEMLSLQQALGKITIVDFWAAWCGPCREENPNLIEIYNDYHDKGLNILGVSLDKDKDKWLQAIKDDKLPWLQISNLMYFKDPIAKLYGLKSIPATFILDKDGVIIAKDLRGKELREKIAELLN